MTMPKETLHIVVGGLLVTVRRAWSDGCPVFDFHLRMMRRGRPGGVAVTLGDVADALARRLGSGIQPAPA